MSVSNRLALPLAILLATLPRPSAAAEAPRQVPAGQAEALDAISADSLRGHLSFLASDLLEGRDTPSRGLDVAAEYIAAQFRRAGLEPIGDDGYFQTARWTIPTPDLSTYRFDLKVGDTTFAIPADRVSLFRLQAIDLKDLPLAKVDVSDPEALKTLEPADFEDKAVVFTMPEADESGRAFRQVLGGLARLRPALILGLDPGSDHGTGIPNGRLIDPDAPARPFGGLRPGGSAAPQALVHDPAAVAALDALPPGPIDGAATLSLGEAVERPAVLRNVVGLLPGSDPDLKDEYVIVSAHYDHIGIRPGAGDTIYNGANDDGSGTVAVVELASALARSEAKPKRSILFVTFFGEEKGLLGSRYFGGHPVVPLTSIVAHLNLEQIGRTDDTEGDQINRASLTGFDFSDLGATFAQAGQATGVEVFKHPRNSDSFFGRSDNQALADLGIPAHTLCVAYIYPDYHGLADHWDKIDYDNFARVVRTVALAVLMVADRPEPPAWSADNPKAARYLKAWKTLHGQPEQE